MKLFALILCADVFTTILAFPASDVDGDGDIDMLYGDYTRDQLESMMETQDQIKPDYEDAKIGKSWAELQGTLDKGDLPQSSAVRGYPGSPPAPKSSGPPAPRPSATGAEPAASQPQPQAQSQAPPPSYAGSKPSPPAYPAPASQKADYGPSNRQQDSPYAEDYSMMSFPVAVPVKAEPRDKSEEKKEEEEEAEKNMATTEFTIITKEPEEQVFDPTATEKDDTDQDFVLADDVNNAYNLDDRAVTQESFEIVTEKTKQKSGEEKKRSSRRSRKHRRRKSKSSDSEENDKTNNSNESKKKKSEEKKESREEKERTKNRKGGTFEETSLDDDALENILKDPNVLALIKENPDSLEDMGELKSYLEENGMFDEEENVSSKSSKIDKDKTNRKTKTEQEQEQEDMADADDMINRKESNEILPDNDQTINKEKGQGKSYNKQNIKNVVEEEDLEMQNSYDKSVKTKEDMIENDDIQGYGNTGASQENGAYDVRKANTETRNVEKPTELEEPTPLSYAAQSSREQHVESKTSYGQKESSENVAESKQVTGNSQAKESNTGFEEIEESKSSKTSYGESNEKKEGYGGSNESKESLTGYGERSESAKNKEMEVSKAEDTPTGYGNSKEEEEAISGYGKKDDMSKEDETMTGYGKKEDMSKEDETMIGYGKKEKYKSEKGYQESSEVKEGYGKSEEYSKKEKHRAKSSKSGYKKSDKISDGYGESQESQEDNLTTGYGKAKEKEHRHSRHGSHESGYESSDSHRTKKSKIKSYGGLAREEFKERVKDRVHEMLKEEKEADQGLEHFKPFVEDTDLKKSLKKKVISKELEDMAEQLVESEYGENSEYERDAKHKSEYEKDDESKEEDWNGNRGSFEEHENEERYKDNYGGSYEASEKEYFNIVKEYEEFSEMEFEAVHKACIARTDTDGIPKEEDGSFSRLYGIESPGYKALMNYVDGNNKQDRKLLAANILSIEVRPNINGSVTRTICIPLDQFNPMIPQEMENHLKVIALVLPNDPNIKLKEFQEVKKYTRHFTGVKNDYHFRYHANDLVNAILDAEKYENVDLHRYTIEFNTDPDNQDYYVGFIIKPHENMSY